MATIPATTAPTQPVPDRYTSTLVNIGNRQFEFTITGASFTREHWTTVASHLTEALTYHYGTIGNIPKIVSIAKGILTPSEVVVYDDRDVQTSTPLNSQHSAFLTQLLTDAPTYKADPAQAPRTLVLRERLPPPRLPAANQTPTPATPPPTPSSSTTPTRTPSRRRARSASPAPVAPTASPARRRTHSAPRRSAPRTQAPVAPRQAIPQGLGVDAQFTYNGQTYQIMRTSGGGENACALNAALGDVLNGSYALEDAKQTYRAALLANANSPALQAFLTAHGITQDTYLVQLRDRNYVMLADEFSIIGELFNRRIVLFSANATAPIIYNDDPINQTVSVYHNGTGDHFFRLEEEVIFRDAQA